MNLGETIKELRKRKGFNQGQLCELCEITQSYLSHIETNNKTPSIPVLESLAIQLDVPVFGLFILAEDWQCWEGISHKNADKITVILDVLKPLI